MSPPQKKQIAKEHYLVGLASKHIGRNPPTLRKLLQNCLFYHEQNNTVPASVALAIKNAMTVWESMGIAVKRFDHCEEKLKREYKEWKTLKDNQYSQSAGQIRRREAFIEKLDAEFDVKREPKNDSKTSSLSSLHVAGTSTPQLVELPDVDEVLDISGMSIEDGKWIGYSLWMFRCFKLILSISTFNAV